MVILFFLRWKKKPKQTNPISQRILYLSESARLLGFISLKVIYRFWNIYKVVTLPTFLLPWLTFKMYKHFKKLHRGWKGTEKLDDFATYNQWQKTIQKKKRTTKWDKKVFFLILSPKAKASCFQPRCKRIFWCVYNNLFISCSNFLRFCFLCIFVKD